MNAYNSLMESKKKSDRKQLTIPQTIEPCEWDPHIVYQIPSWISIVNIPDLTEVVSDNFEKTHQK